MLTYLSSKTYFTKLVRALPDLQNLKSRSCTPVLKTRADVLFFFHAGIKARRDEGVERILLGDNTDYGTIVLRPIVVPCVVVGYSTALPHRPYVY
jgi:hypothetical protein